jgi:hypothetical protein
MKRKEKDHGEIGNKGTKGIKERKRELFFPSSLMVHVLVVT